jgi:hypothetical protein
VAPKYQYLTTRCHVKKYVFHNLNLIHISVSVISKNRNSFTLLKYDKVFLVKRIHIRNATVSFLMSVSLSVHPFNDRKYQAESHQRDSFYSNTVLVNCTKLC